MHSTRVPCASVVSMPCLILVQWIASIVVCSQLVAAQGRHNCTNSTLSASEVFTIESNRAYLFEDCESSGLHPFILLGVTSSSDSSSIVLENVSVVVRRGNVLPLLILNHRSTKHEVKNISIVVIDVFVNRTLILDNELPGVLPSSLSFFYLRGTLSIIENVQLIITGCHITLNVNTTNVRIISAVNFLLHVDNGATEASQVRDIMISVCNRSDISIEVRSTKILTCFGLVGFAFAGRSNASNLQFSVVDGSSLSLLIDVQHVVTVFSDSLEPALFWIRCQQDQVGQPFIQRCSISKVDVSLIPAAYSLLPSSPAASNARISVQMLLPAKNNISDSVSLARITHFFLAANILLSLDAAEVVLRCVCAGSGCGEVPRGVENVQDGDLLARIFHVRGARVTNQTLGFESEIHNMTLQFLSSASVSSILIEASKTGFLGAVGYAREVRNVSFLCRSPNWWNMTLIGRGIGVGQSTRDLGVFELSSATGALDIAVFMENINLDIFALSQDCMLIVTPVVSLIGNISQVNINITNVTMFANVSGGTTYVLLDPRFTHSVEFFTAVSTFVSITPQDQVVVEGRQLSIHISDSTIQACHTSNRPASPPFLPPVIGSVVAALNIPRSLEDCVIELNYVNVKRRFPESAGPLSWYKLPVKEGSILVNVTTLLAGRDPTTTLMGVSNVPFFKIIAVAAFGGSASLLTITFNNVRTAVRHSSVSYDPRLLSGVGGSTTAESVEVLTLYLLPWLMNNSTFHTTDCVTPSTPTTRRYSFGAFISLMVSTYMENTTLAFSNVSLGFSALLALAYQGTLTMVYGSAAMQFVNVAVEGRESATQQQQQHAVIIAVNGANISVSQPGNIIATSSPSTSLTMAPLYVSHSSFRNFGTLLPLDVWLAPSPEVRGGTTPYIQLGCNLWNDAPMAPRVLMTTTNNSQYIDMSSVSYPMSRYNASVTCDGLSTATSSEDESIPPAASASITVVIGTVGGVLSSAAMLDAQGLAVLGLSESCSPPTLRDSSASASQYLISPFYSLGIAAIVFGNLGLFVVLHGTHRVLVALLRKRQVQAKPMTLFSQMGENSSLVPFKATQPSIPIPLRPEVAYKFPNHSILVATMLAPGVVHGGTRGLFSGDVLSTTAGIVAAFVLAAGVWWRVRAGRSRDATKLKYVPYKYAVLRSAAVPHYALPLGQWGPPAARATHGRLRGAIRSGCEWLSAQSLCVGLVVQVVASIPVPTSWCVGLWFLLSLVQVVGAAIVIAFRPARAPLSDWLQVCGYGFAAALQIIVGLTSMEVLDQQDGATLSALSLCVMAVSACKACHAGVVFMWEQRQERHAAMDTGPLAVTDIPMMMTASSRRALRSAPIMMNIRIREALKELVVAACAKAQQKDEKNICMSEV
ncbi:membrane-associated protein, putative [Bodo saltans]|uniref:Membrane-associated protein, putative n=1 Tax=Bodo saltans TaxID=75058 RepID=A0A0S4JGQ5_BODSA|nr:membrane-associated protein, putative [Bodo saltans]|eukprot:CUG89711.1 membrane-associated protein, putative [Bodo saltans]